MITLPKFPFQRKPDVITVERLAGVWRYRCTLPSGRSFTGEGFHATAVEAADQAAKLAVGNPHAQLNFDADVREGLIARWQMEGIEAQRQGKSALCWTKYHREAYQAAANEAQGVFVFGWPAAQPAMAVR